MLAETCIQVSTPPRVRKRPKRYEDGEDQPLIEVVKRRKRKSSNVADTASSSAVTPPAAAAVSVEEQAKKYEFQPQTSRCYSSKYEWSEYEDIPRCISCVRRQAGDTCRFMGIRIFTRNPKTHKLVGYTFPFHHAQDGPHMEFPTSWNTEMCDTYIRRTKAAIARSLLPVLQLALEHQTIPDAICRPPEMDVRATCDTCLTSIFSSSWMCTLCGQECCADCFNEVRRLTNPTWNSIGRNSQTTPEKLLISSKPTFLACTRGEKHGDASFLAVSRFTLNELDVAINEMEHLLKTPLNKVASDSPSKHLQLSVSHPTPASGKNDQTALLLNTVEGAQDSPLSPLSAIPDDMVNNEISSDEKAKDETAGNAVPMTVPSHDTLTFTDSELTEDKFRDAWTLGYPLVVTGQLAKFQLSWTPDYFIEKYGDQPCSIVECQTNEIKHTTVGEFFKQFKNQDGRTGCWKLKDWPPSMDFKTAFPELYEDFARAAPMPNYTRRDGVLNIASHFPSNTVAPDIGPKMYNAMKTFETEGSNGTTRLHMDMADAVNVMLHSEPNADGSQGVAAWDLFRPEDSDAIRKFLRQKFPDVQRHDPIHVQRFYLDSKLRRELYDECGVMSHRIYQRPGDAVFIPAGCAHQVCNLADCIKVAVDFVSPENITRCEKLTQEFREENLDVVWKEDVLQLRTMMWFAWLSCSRQEAKLSP